MIIEGRVPLTIMAGGLFILRLFFYKEIFEDDCYF